MRFGVLGPLQIRGDDGSPLNVRPGKVLRTLCALLSRGGDPVPVGQLVDALWPGQPPPSAVKTVQTNVCRLRQDLGEAGRILTRPGGYAIALGPDELDAQRFDAHVLAARKALRHDDLGRAADELTTALRLWRGRPYTGLEDCAFLTPEVERLAELRIQALEELTDVRLRRGEATAVVPELAALVAENPYRERLSAQLMLALHRSGRQSDALEVYRRTYARLSDELGVEPGHELRRLHEAILRSDATLDQRPESRRAPAQLPPDLASFTGRRAELDALLATVAPGESAESAEPAGAVVISAIDGMAGIGKTVLAVHAAHRLAASYPDGQFFLDLHGFTLGMPPVEPALALERMLRATGVPGDQLPHTLDERSALWRTRLAGKRALVLLDNAADEAQVEPLLPGSRDCLVLVTSRRRLGGIDGAVPVSLDVPELADAVALLGEAGAGELAGEVADLCGRLPLAIRLLAARLRSRPHWTLADVVDRLRDRHNRLAELGGDRERSVAGAFDLSYHGLSADERRVFRLLGLHPGADFDASAVAALAGIPLRTAEQILETLVDAHLLESRAYGRYTFHDLLRIHAAEAAGHDEPDAERRAAVGRLLDHGLRTVATAMRVYAPSESPPLPDALPAGPELATREQAVAWLDLERANLVALACLAADQGWPEHASGLSVGLHRYLTNAAHHSEALVLYQHALRACRRAGDRTGEARALKQIGFVHSGMARNAEALGFYRQSLELSVEPADRAAVLANIGKCLSIQGRYAEAIDPCEEAVAASRAAGDRLGEARAYSHLGNALRRLGRFDEALSCVGDAAELARLAGDQAVEGGALVTRGLIELDIDREAEAVDHLRQAVVLHRAAGNREGEYVAFVATGNALAQLGRRAEALEAYAQVLAIAEEIGDANGEYEAYQGIGEALRAEGRPGEALDQLGKALGLAQDLEQEHDVARSHEALGKTCRDLDEVDQARVHVRQALEIYRRQGTPEASAMEELLAELGGLSRPAPRASR